MSERFFTPKEANQNLPLVKKIVEDIISKGKEAKILLTMTGTHYEREGKLVEIEHQIKNLMAQLENMGCYYKDWNFEIGLVDFPAIIHGQEALLCWRSDEPQVVWFHGYEDGYAGRRPVTQDLIF